MTESKIQLFSYDDGDMTPVTSLSLSLSTDNIVSQFVRQRDSSFRYATVKPGFHYPC